MKKSQLVGFLMALVGSFSWGLAVGIHQVFPFEQLRAVKRLIIQSELDDLTRSPRATQFKLFRPPSDVVMIGDSITESGLWNEILPGIRVANRGLDGDTTAGVLARMNDILATQARSAFVLLGINDLGRGDGVPQVLERYERIILALQAAGMEVFVQSTLRCSVRQCARYANRIPELNRGLEALAARRGARFIDLNALLAEPDGGLLEVHSHDGVHLLASGFNVWAEAIYPYLSSQTMVLEPEGLIHKKR